MPYPLSDVELDDEATGSDARSPRRSDELDEDIMFSPQRALDSRTKQSRHVRKVSTRDYVATGYSGSLGGGHVADADK